MAAAKPKVAHVQMPGTIDEPLDYLLSVMKDTTADPIRRDRAAIAAAQYMHARRQVLGKSDERKSSAKAVTAGRFGAGVKPGVKP